MSVQICEGIWRNRLRQRVVVTQCEPVDGQRWTDGAHHFEDNGALLTFSHSNLDLVEYIGPLPDSSQRAPVSRPAETESTTGVEGGVANDPGRVIYDLEEKLKTANATIDNQSADIARLQAELRGYAAETHRQLRTLQESHNKVTANLQAEQRGEREGFRIAISMILEAVK